MLRLLNVSRRMAKIELTGGSSIMLSRSKRDGTTVGVLINGRWKTLQTAELLDALTWVTLTDEQLIEQGMAEVEVKPPRPKRTRKPKYIPF